MGISATTWWITCARSRVDDALRALSERTSPEGAKLLLDALPWAGDEDLDDPPPSDSDYMAEEGRLAATVGLAFESDGTIEADYERFQCENVKTISPPVEIERDGRCVARALYVFDPDGLQIELYQPMVAIEDAS